MLIDHPSGGQKDVGVLYWCWCKEKFDVFFESELRPMTWREFRWMKHPESGQRMVGRTPAFMVAIIHAAAVAIAAASTAGGGWPVAVIGHSIGMGIIALFWWGTYENFTKRWV
jgi:hypothetical protein